MGARVDIDRSERRTFAMRSPVNWALLGLLIERPGYGYDLCQRFKRTYGKSIELSCQAQIYKGLDALEERGLIEPLASEETLPEELRQAKDPLPGARRGGTRLPGLADHPGHAGTTEPGAVSRCK